MTNTCDNMTEYACIHEEKLQEHDTQIGNLNVRLDYKEDKINTIIKNNERMESKIDKLTELIHKLELESAQDDYNIDSRVTSLEATITTLERVVIIVPTIISVIITVLSFLIMNFKG